MNQPRVMAKTSGDTATISLYGDIGGSLFDDGITAKDVAAALAECAGAKTLNIAISSYGGDVFEGFSIYNLIKRHSATQKIVTVDGIAASAGSLICMAGTTILMGKSSMLMLHEASSRTSGTADEMRDTADRLEKINASMTQIYSSRSGQSQSTIRKMLAKEVWLTAKESVDLGLADKVIKDDAQIDDARAGMRAVASASPLIRQYRNAPARLLAGFDPALSQDLFKENKVKVKKLLKALGLHSPAGEREALLAIQELRAKAGKFDALQDKGTIISRSSDNAPSTDRVLSAEQIAAAAKAGWGAEKLAWIKEQIQKNGAVPREVA